LAAGEPGVRSGTERGAVVRPGWLRGAFTLGKASDAFGFELRKLRLNGRAQANPFLTAAAIDGVQASEAIRVRRTGSIEHGRGLASDWAAETTPGAAPSTASRATHSRVPGDGGAAATDRERQQQAEPEHRNLAG
jgi:hypothetical protein